MGRGWQEKPTGWRQYKEDLTRYMCVCISLYEMMEGLHFHSNVGSNYLKCKTLSAAKVHFKNSLLVSTLIKGCF